MFPNLLLQLFAKFLRYLKTSLGGEFRLLITDEHTPITGVSDWSVSCVFYHLLQSYKYIAMTENITE